MTMRNVVRALSLAITCTSSVGLAADAAGELAIDRDHLVVLLAGEFDNWAQVSDAGPDAGKPSEHVHAAFAEVEVGDMAGPLMYGQMAAGGPGGEVFRQRLYAFDVDPEVDAIVMTIFRLQDEALVLDSHRHPERMLGVLAEDLLPLTGCEILWRRTEDGFLGVSSGEPCLVTGGPDGEVQFFHRMEVGAEGLKLHEWAVDALGTAVWGGPDEPPLDLRRCRFFRGEAVLPAVEGGEPRTHELELHDQGGGVSLPAAQDGSSVELRLVRSRPPRYADPELTLSADRIVADGGAARIATVRAGADASHLALEVDGLDLELARVEDGSADLDRLAAWLAGSFASTAQATADEDYLDIRLRMAPIWTGRTDGRWLYVEQAVADYRDRPYRQRVYRVREIAPGLFESEVYALPDPEGAVGAWRHPEPLADLAPGRLEPRTGCSILMRRQADAFVGGTLGRLCPSDLRGARYATSEVRITADGMVSWDRGFSADGAQVWGATEGGYVFDRIGEAAAADPEVGSQEASGPETSAAADTPEPPATEEVPPDTDSAP